MDRNNNLEYTKGALIKSSGVGAAVAPTKFNPEFVSQFDINITPKFYRYRYEGDDAAETPILANVVELAPASLPSQLQVPLAFFLFGKSDSNGGYQNANELVPVSNWNYEKNLTVNGGTALNFYYLRPISSTIFPITNPLKSINDGVAKRGDVLQVYTYTEQIDNSFQFYLYTAEIIIECKQVSYGTLLDSTSSDRFTINNIRYKTPTGLESQFENPLRLIKQTLFGKMSTDEVTPAAFQLPNNFQNSIIDIPLVKGVDKETSICSNINFDVKDILLSVFVLKQTKVTQEITK